MSVVDLGARREAGRRCCARGWARRRTIVALDLLPMDPMPGVTFLQGDFREDEALAELERRSPDGNVDLVVSDLAPNLSGVESGGSGALGASWASWRSSSRRQWLQPGGDLVSRRSRARGSTNSSGSPKQRFDKVYVRKPKASRDRSREVYLVGKGPQKR